MKQEAKQVQYWERVFNRIPGIAHERIENKVKSGTPDYAYCINGVNGWIEFKVADGVPKRKETALKLGHWSGLQRVWMQARHTCPTVFFFLRVGEYDYILNTHTMFEIEQRPYSQILEDPNIFKVKIKKVSDWSISELLEIGSILEGNRVVPPQE